MRSVGDRGSERADRKVGPLRHCHHLGAFGDMNRPRAEWPSACDRPEQGRFAFAIAADQGNAIAFVDAAIDPIQQRHMAVSQREIAQCQQSHGGVTEGQRMGSRLYGSGKTKFDAVRIFFLRVAV